MGVEINTRAMPSCEVGDRFVTTQLAMTDEEVSLRAPEGRMS